MAEKRLIEIGNSFWNLRGSAFVLYGLVDVGTHMSFIKLNSGKFLILDTILIDPVTKIEIDQLTNNGELIEAVVAVHPFHTLFFTKFYEMYPKPLYYGTPRHLRMLKNIPWSGSIDETANMSKWESDEVFIRIPDGTDFVNPIETSASGHFTSAVVFHKPSRTIHVDDTLNYITKVSFLGWLVGNKIGDLKFHFGVLNGGLKPTEEAPLEFRDWVLKLLNDWDFDNICSAHTGNLMGGAKEKLQKTITSFTPQLEKLSLKNGKK